MAWVIVLIGSWTWNRWEAKRGPLPHDISRTTRADVCALGVNALFPDNVTHIQDARRNTLGASPSAKGGRFSLQRRFNCSGGPSGDAGDARKGGTTMNVIAYIRNDFQEKFGIPRQSGVVETALSEIIFEPDYRSAEALRGLEGFSHIWLIWAFSASAGKGWVAHGPASAFGRQCAGGRFCLALAVPSKSAGAVGGEAGKYCASVPGRPVVTGFWGRSAAWNADFGYKTLPSLRRLYPSGDRRFCGNEAGTPA